MTTRLTPQNERQDMKTILPSFTEQESFPRLMRDIQPFTSGWIHGTVVGVELSRDLIFLRARETQRREAIHWAPGTQFALDGHDASSADLRLGQRVRIHCRFVNHELLADNITIGRYDQPGSSQPKVMPLHPEPPQEEGGGNLRSQLTP